MLVPLVGLTLKLNVLASKAVPLNFILVTLYPSKAIIVTSTSLIILISPLVLVKETLPAFSSYSLRMQYLLVLIKQQLQTPYVCNWDE